MTASFPPTIGRLRGNMYCRILAERQRSMDPVLQYSYRHTVELSDEVQAEVWRRCSALHDQRQDLSPRPGVAYLQGSRPVAYFRTFTQVWDERRRTLLPRSLFTFEAEALIAEVQAEVHRRLQPPVVLYQGPVNRPATRPASGAAATAARARLPSP